MNVISLSSARQLALTSAVLAALLAGCGSDRPETMIASAKQFLTQNDAKAAVIQLKNALQKNPESAEARYLLGVAMLATDDPVSAEKELRKAKELGYEPDKVSPPLAQALFDTRQSKKLIDEFAGAQLADLQAGADLAATVGHAYLNVGKTDEARKQFAMALRVAAAHPQATLGEARMKVGNNDLSGATALVNDVLAKNPRLLSALLFKAELLTVTADRSTAIKAYDDIIAIHPTELRAHSNRLTLYLLSDDLATAATHLAAFKKLAPQSPQSSYFQALLALKRKEFPAAREAIQQVLKIAPAFLPGQLIAAEIEFQLNSLPQAQQHLQRVLDAAPGNTAAVRMLAAVHLRMGQPSRALEVLTPQLNAKVNDPGLLMLAGDVYLNNNDLAQAESYFAKAAAADKSSVSARTRLSQVLFAGGDVVGGLQQLETAVSLDVTQYQADVMLISAHLRRKEIDKAFAAIATLEKKQPKNPLTYYLRAAASAMKDDVIASRRDLERAIELDPVYFPAALTLAKLDIQDKKFDSARHRFEKILEKDPKNPQAMLALAQVRAAMNAPASEVSELLDKAVKSNPTNVELRLAQLRHQMARGDYVKAEAAAQDANAAIGDTPALVEALGMAQQARGSTQQAIATFSKLVAMKPKSPEPLFRLATAELADKRKDASMQTLRRSLALKPDFLEAQLGLISVYNKDGRTSDAMGIAKAIQKQRPKASVGYLVEGDIYAEQKKWIQAAAAYRGGLDKLRDGYIGVKYHGALFAAGRSKEAESFSADWTRNNPRDVVFRAYLAERSLSAKNYQAAAEQYRDILAITPKSPLILNNLAWAAGQLNDPKALTYAEEANKLQPNNPAILDTLGTLLSSKGDAARSIELLRQATTLAPTAWAVRINLVMALAKAGQREAAKKELEPMLKLDPKDPAHASAVELNKTL